MRLADRSPSLIRDVAYVSCRVTNHNEELTPFRRQTSHLQSRHTSRQQLNELVIQLNA